jgi:serine/threonine protein kinase/formylglycine-generating enzyme required for sulfatase activity
MDSVHRPTPNEPPHARLKPLDSTKSLLREGRTIDDREAAAPEALALSLLPERIGRFRVEKVLGTGGFGIVYLARDEQLNRQVAIKVPHAKRVSRPEDAQLYLTEAQTVASLEHPHIVPVYDVGGTADHPFFVVSKYVQGADLATSIRAQRLSWQQAAQLIATVADALHYAHKQGLVHRDVKPRNILIDVNGNPFVVDFGLALREENVGEGPPFAGTPTYMSPEQARGEGHRVDGRSDIFALGVVFYELLVGHPPFRSDRLSQIFEQITSQEPRPPRQYDDSIPKEVERICLKALSKRATDRYTTAKDFADDLRHFLNGLPDSAGTIEPRITVKETLVAAATPAAGSVSVSRAIKIVPKGLRSFDAHDADFFLELLPGPRDRDGLPDSIRFWKTRIEETDADEAFSVGLIYGPSGCGKSSLVKAGLLPRLADHILPVYVESTADETESRLLHGLHKRCPGLPDNLNLQEALAALRRGQGMARGAKVLLVLDQFEQWLHSHGQQENADLVQALRQCDGGRVQCLLMVRDDFWMAVTRFLDDLEVELLQGRNFTAVDLFDLRHAQRVLKAYGRAYGALPEFGTELETDQQRFLDQAVSGLSQDGKVICVRLALFAEMIKSKPWTTDSLKGVGGTEGVGVAFLEETFSAATANPKHRLHQKSARAVLKALLPETGTDIKGNMRSYQELLAVSGYSSRPKDFEDLIRILDGEIRLITPTDPEGSDAEDGEMVNAVVGPKYYQLTHDYLVHPLRDWLTAKQKETRRGRAELRLAERAALWNAKPENRHLPSLGEYLSIRLLTDPRKWTSPQRKMMALGGRFHGVRIGIAAALLIGLTTAGLAMNRKIDEKGKADHAAALVKQLLSADTGEVPGIVQEINDSRDLADPLLRQEDAKPSLGLTKKVHLALGLLPVDQSKITELREDLLLVPPSQFSVILEALAPFKLQVTEPLWDVALDTKEKKRRRFQAACALATFATHDPRWTAINSAVANQLVTLKPSEFAAWNEILRPAGDHLIGPLSVVFRDPNRSQASRSYATETLADLASDRTDQLFDLLADAESFQFPLLFQKLGSQKGEVVALANHELARKLPAEASEDQKEVLAKRQANAAVALYRLGSEEQVWPLLEASRDNRVRSYVVHWLSERGGDPQAILRRLDDEPDVTIRRALLLSLGQFTETQLPAAGRQPLIERLLSVYKNEPDAGLHGASEWLLRKWGQQKRLETIVERLECDARQLEARKPNDKRRWYVNTRKQTFAIIDAGEFLMGSLDSEPSRSPSDNPIRFRIGRTFAIAAEEVTKAQYRTFQQAVKAEDLANHPVFGEYVPTDDSAQLGVTWYDAARYCDWLSEQDNIPRGEWCYDPKGGVYGPGLKAKDQFWKLKGYRLPTQVEWEFACRAGTVTSRYYGASDELLPYYARFDANNGNHSWPVGALEPNDFGLFDMLGNARELCFDAQINRVKQEQDKVVDDSPVPGPVEPAVTRVVRGGSYRDSPSGISAGRRCDTNGVNARNSTVGFRPARTY